MAVKKPAKPKKVEEPKKLKVDPQAASHDVHLYNEVEVLVHHPDGYPVELTLHPRKREYTPLRYFESLRKIGSADSADNVAGVMECLRMCLPEAEYELAMDNATVEDLEQLVPVIFGADPS